MTLFTPPSSSTLSTTQTKGDGDELDLPSQKKYYAYLSRSGLAGLVILGTNAETFLLTRDERRALLQCARDACGPDFPIMAGVGGHSTAQVLEYVQDAADAGADYILLLPVGYLGLKPSSPPEVIHGFFRDVSRFARDKGRNMGTVVYNFPGVCNGVDLDSATIATLARENKGNIVGVKLTCGSVAKITRLAAELDREDFAVFGGQSDFLIGGLAVGSAGCIAAFANVVPRTIVRVYDLWKKKEKGMGGEEEALRLHRTAALAEQKVKAGGVAAVKYAASLLSAPRAGVEGAEALMAPRRPYLPLGEEAKRVIREGLAGVLEIEGRL